MPDSERVNQMLIEIRPLTEEATPADLRRMAEIFLSWAIQVETDGDCS